MILSVSRRTDIPACYWDWFLNRVKEGYLYVKNPMNPHQVSKIEVSPETVDCMVFWTKNPGPMLEKMEEIQIKKSEVLRQFRQKSRYPVSDILPIQHC